ncbi:MAG: hypothetical protein ACYSWX_14840, partial [Planctomycetota bacterium]
EPISRPVRPQSRALCSRVGTLILPARFRAALPLAGLSIVALVATGCSSTPTTDSVEELIRQARYAEAVELAERMAADSPGDAAKKQELTRARVALLLDRARDHNFADEFAQSLALLDEAESLMPGQAQVAEWRQKNMRELAGYHREVARKAESSGDFDAAYLAFLESARLDPLEPAGRNGAERVLLRDNYRRGLGASYYKEGVKRLREYRTNEAVQQLAAADEYLTDDPRLADRRVEAGQVLAEERVNIAREFEGEGLFRAARNEYRIALLVVDDLQEAIDGLERCEREVQVLDFLEEADRELRREDFDQARIRVERAAVLTVAQVDAVESARVTVEDARIQSLYDGARELESDFEFSSAIAAYESLLDETEGFYADALTRLDTLRGYIDQAAALYARANETADLAEQESLLYQITLFWPTYRDVRSRYAAVKSRLDAEAAATAGE